MTITINTLIRAGTMAQSKFEMKEDFEIRLFPTDSPNIVRVYETPKPVSVSEFPHPYVDAPRYDDVILSFFAAKYNNDEIIMGYSRKLNILCLVLI